MDAKNQHISPQASPHDNEVAAAVRLRSEPKTPDDIRSLVKQAADELLTDGVCPTVANIRVRIGRGSTSAIDESLREWWQELSRRLAAVRFRHERPQISGLPLEHVDQMLAEYRDKTDKKLAQATEAANSALLARDEAQNNLQKLQRDYKRLEEARVELERRLTVEAAKRQVTGTKIQEIQADAARRVAEVRERIRQLEEMLEIVLARYDSMEKRLTLQIETYNNENSTLCRQRDQLVAENTELRERFAQLQNFEESLRGEIKVLR